MKQVAIFDRGDHWEVIADYSLSPRHASLSEEQWKSEFAGPGYEAMRTSQPGLVAAHAPKGIGKWKKDWSGPHVIQSPRIQILCNSSLDFDRVPVVAASSTHVLMVKKLDQDGKTIPGSEPLRTMISAPIPLSPGSLALQNGEAILTVGPCPNPCDVNLTVVDPAGAIKKGSIALRFR